MEETTKQAIHLGLTAPEQALQNIMVIAALAFLVWAIRLAFQTED